MVDQTHPPDRPAALACPWCSATVQSETTVCPSCHAILISDEEHDLPGVTTVDPTAARGEMRPATRGRFLTWLGGDDPENPAKPEDAQAIARPDADVQREILRLELAARISDLQAEADSIASDALVEGRVAELPAGMHPPMTVGATGETPADEAPADAATDTTDAATDTTDQGAATT
jgi:RNA polymerase subunit RPABC4/transcription elongation factor Spt4